jgi:hypothetical protein
VILGGGGRGGGEGSGFLHRRDHRIRASPTISKNNNKHPPAIRGKLSVNTAIPTTGVGVGVGVVVAVRVDVGATVGV